MILSFSLTTKEFLSGTKTVTRRVFSQNWTEMWQSMWDRGRYTHDAWDKLPRVPGAQKIGKFKLTCRPYLEALRDMPESDLIYEGNMAKDLDEFCKLIKQTPDTIVTVIRFEKV